jgi:hypothetical protein
MLSYSTSWRSILILSYHLRLGLPSGLFPSSFPIKTLYTPLLSPYMLHSPPISFFSIWSPEQYWVRSKGKGKAVPLQAWSDPEGSRKLRCPDFMIMAQDGGKVVSLTHRPPLLPGNTPGTHFC